MPTVLITGAGRGLGLEFARQYRAEGWQVIATCRDPSQRPALLQAVPGASVHSLDVTDFPAVYALGRELGGETIDVMIANAGVLLAGAMPPDALDADAWLQSFRVNAMAPLACAGAFLAQVARSKERKMIAISSLVGSIGAATRGGHYAYRSSKAALNSVWRAFALDHPEVITALLSPGRMRTGMIQNETDAAVWETLPLPAERAVQLRSLIARLKQGDSGGFFHQSGSVLPW